jgi:hypothetical protein
MAGHKVMFAALRGALQAIRPSVESPWWRTWTATARMIYTAARNDRAPWREEHGKLGPGQVEAAMR